MLTYGSFCSHTECKAILHMYIATPSLLMEVVLVTGVNSCSQDATCKACLILGIFVGMPLKIFINH